jgi:hypothetical protein
MTVTVDGRPVAFARMLLAVALVITVVESGAYLSRIAIGRMAYPVFEAIAPPSPLAVQVYLVVGLLAAVCLGLGLYAGASAAAGSLTLLWALIWDQQTYSSHHLLLMLLLGYLAFARCDARWGVSSSRHGRDCQVPWWPQLLMLSQISACYLFAALSKVNGVFLSGEPLAGWTWLTLPGWVFVLMAWGTVITELFLAIGLWLPRTRHIAVLAGLVLHVSIVVALSDLTVILLGFALSCIATYWMYLTRPSLGWLNSLKRSGAPDVRSLRLGSERHSRIVGGAT